MRPSRSKLSAAVAVAGTVAATGLLTAVGPAAPARAHGSVASPPSRAYVCWQEGPETPRSDACKAAVAEGGTQAFYDWNEVSLIDVDGRHRERIPDGKLCSAGRDKYRGLDLRRADWPARNVSPCTPQPHTRGATSSSTSLGRAGRPQNRCAGRIW